MARFSDRLGRLARGYVRASRAMEAALDGWFLGLAARLTFAAVLLGYYWNSALTKIEPGFFGFLAIRDAAYFQIIPLVVEARGYDASAVPVFPWGAIVALGTYSEFILPALIVLGLFTRLAALGMIGFIVIQSYVDIAYHGADATTIGTLFDRLPDSAILDQRALWVFLLLVLVVKGAGLISVDALLGRWSLRSRAAAPAE